MKQLRMNFPLVTGCFLLLSISAVSARAQPPLIEPLIVEPREENSARRMIHDLMVEIKVAEATEPMRAATLFDVAWELAVLREDPLIDLKTDALGVLAPEQHQVDAGSRSQLQGLFQSLSAAFQKAYQDNVLTDATRTLGIAARGTERELATAIQRYQFTPQGQQALEALLRLQLSRGEYLQAALQFGRLMNLRADRTPESTLQLALLWWNADLPEEAIQYLREIVRAFPAKEITVGGRMIKLPDTDADLELWMTEFAEHDTGMARHNSGLEWTQPLGNYRRTQRQKTGPAILTPRWNASSFECVWNSELNILLKPAAEYVRRDAAWHLERNSVIAPAAAPLVVGDLLIFRGVANIRAVDRQTGELVWESSFIDAHLEAAREAVYRSAEDGRSNIDVVHAILRSSFLNHLVRANTGGQLTCAGNVLFAVEEVTAETMRTDWDNQIPRALRAVNYLRAYDVRSGQAVGILGGTVGLSADDAAPNPLRGYYVLGVPLVMGERIYVMAENDQGIFLLQLLASQFDQQRAPFSQQPVHSQLLSVPRHSLRDHPVRMYAGVTPSYGRGLLICNTCDEKVIAVSAEDHSVRWVYRYPTNVAEPELNHSIAVVGNAANAEASALFDLSNRWLDALPRIVADHVLLTPRDSDRLICLDLQTGQQVWTKPRGSMRRIVYVDDQRIVLTGTEHVECLNFADGSQQWQTQIETGHICGEAAADGHVVHIPTSEPSVVTVDIIDGRRLLIQPVSGGIPGNLLSVDGQLFSQSLTDVRSFGTIDNELGSPLQLAGEKFLQRDVVGGEKLLRTMLDDTQVADSLRDHARTLLIDTLLESLRMDFHGNQTRVADVERLIEDSSPRTEDILALTRTMLGISPARMESLPGAWSRVENVQRQLERLHVLTSRHQLEDIHEPVERVAEHILNMLDAAVATTDSFTRTGTLTQRHSRITAGAIRRALSLRDQANADQIREIVKPALLSRVRDDAAAAQIRWWVNMAHMCSFTHAAIEACHDEKFSDQIATAVKDNICFDVIDNPDDKDRVKAASSLFDRRTESGRAVSFSDLARRSLQIRQRSDNKSADVLADASVGRNYLLPEDVPDTETLRQWASLTDDAQKTPWTELPTVTESPARSVGPPTGVSENALQLSIPLYGNSGAFPGWFVGMKQGTSSIQAYDDSGVKQWSFDLSRQITIDSGGYGYRFNRLSDLYAVAYGHLLAVKLQHMVLVLDCSHASIDHPPALLWDVDIFEAFTFPTFSQQSDPAWQRTTQYDLRPAGLFPVGPLTRFGLPIYCGRRLIMFDVMTGAREWQVDGLPEDGTLTATDSELMLISESSGNVEVRDLIDGQVVVRTPLPEWWTEAAENSNSSIRDFEVEPGEQQHWRLALENGQCLLLRRNVEASALEMFDLRSGQVNWSVDLAQDSVVSNIVDGHIAVLSDGDRLQIWNLFSARKITDLVVPPAAGSRQLHLRPAGGKWLVMTDVFDEEHDFQNHVSANTSVQVNGPIYAVDQETGKLTWSTEVEHRFLRILNPSQGPIPAITPLLVLLKQPYRRDANGLPRGATVQAAIYDARTGKLLYEDDDLGYGLSYHRLSPDSSDNRIDIEFDKRTITFDYNKTNDE